MSHYTTITVEFRDAEALHEALTALGVVAELHQEPVFIKDWERKITDLKAHVIIRKDQIGLACNDIGFFCGPQPKAHICNRASDKLATPAFMAKLKQEYVACATTRHYAKQGKKVRRVNDGDKVKLYVSL